MKTEALYELYQQHPSVQTDSRQMQPGDLFFALKGPNFNGNDFAKQAIAQGAAYVIVDEDVEDAGERIIRVEDSLRSLQELAAFHRKRFTIPFIAITGSNGKTTTKELIHKVLSTEYQTYTTQGNLNNHIGIPLTILKIRDDAQMAVIEMGANHRGEIAAYCQYARPGYGLITNIGKAHMEGFGGEQGVREGKGELFAYLEKHEGTAFVNADDPKVLDLAATLSRKILYGSNTRPPQGMVASCDPFLSVRLSEEDTLISTKMVGSYNLHNVLAAYTIGRHFGVSVARVKQAIEEYNPSNSRSQMLHRGSNTIIMDAYNANPGSMRAAIENFARMKGKNKVLVLGDMKELGEAGLAEHQSVVDIIMKYEWHRVALAGPLFSGIAHPFHSFPNADEARKWFSGQNLTNSMILVKGSRSMQMEKVID